MFVIKKGNKYVSEPYIKGMYTDNVKHAAVYATRRAANLEKLSNEHVEEITTLIDRVEAERMSTLLFDPLDNN